MSGPLGLIPGPKLQFFVPGSLVPAAGGLLFTYAAGTTTKQLTYINNGASPTPNTNPIVLDANGQCVCFLDSTLAYDVTYAPSTDTDPPTAPYWTVGNVGYASIIAGLAPLASPAFTGSPTAPTATLGDNSTALANTAFVQAAIGNISATTTAITQPAGTLNTTIATTAFVGSEITNAPQMQLVSSSGNFTVPAGVTRIKYRAWGGGGGGGASPGGLNSGGGGGGGGGYAEGIYTVTPGLVLNVVIATGGQAGTGTSAGFNGSATTISGIGINCSGGFGGGGGSSGGAILGGLGGSASGGTWSVTGGQGGTGFNYGNGSPSVGIGGGSFGTPTSPNSSASPGGGGAGGGNSSPGAVGGIGLVIFEWLKP